MSIQLFNVEELEIDEINDMVNEMLLKISIKLDLDFSLVDLNDQMVKVGNDGLYGIQFNNMEYEHIPVLYLNNALHTQDVRLSFLSYYQVIEYFFIRIQNYNFLSEFNKNNFETNNIDHKLLRKVLQTYKNTLSERESLKLVLKHSIVISDFKNWINNSPERITKYCNNATYQIDLTKRDDKILDRLGERIYYYRCSIAHAKGDIDEYIAIPTLNDFEIKNELELMKYVSYEVLKKCSEV